MGKITLAAILFALPIEWATACPRPLPAEAKAIEIENFDLGLCWLTEALAHAGRSHERLSEQDEDRILRLADEMVMFLPSPQQRLALVQRLLPFTRARKLKLRLIALEMLGSLRTPTPAVRRALERALRSRDFQVRETAVRALAALNPQDPEFQDRILAMYNSDPESTVRAAALESLYLRTPQAAAALADARAQSENAILKQTAENKIRDWDARPLATTPAAYSMATLGDSISVGFFADTSVASASQYQVEPKDLNLFWFLNHSRSDEGLARSWSSGGKIESHYFKLKEQLKTNGLTGDLAAHNVAFAGAKSDNLVKEVASLEAKLALAPSELIYTTLFIGSNDACAGVASDTIVHNIHRALVRLNRLQQGHGQMTVLISSLLPIDALAKPQISDLPGVGGLTCRQVQRDHLQFCNKFYAPPSPEAEAANKAEIQEINRKLQALTQSARDLTNLRLIYAASLSRADVIPDAMAFDCFHPNELGQRAISEALWADLLKQGGIGHSQVGNGFAAQSKEIFRK